MRKRKKKRYPLLAGCKGMTPGQRSKHARSILSKKQNGRCYWCDIQTLPGKTATIDHVIPRSKGGTDNMSNLVLACRKCNETKAGRFWERKPFVATVSFDFDDTLTEPTGKFIELLREYHTLGCQCIVLTARTPSFEKISEVDLFLEEHNLTECVSYVVYTSHQDKGPYARDHGVNLHYDDKEDHLKSVKSFGIQVVSAKFLAAW